MADVIVIGGGIVGTTAAWQLAAAGAEVMLLERGALASGATARSQGLILPPDHPELDAVQVESLRLYRELAGIADVALDVDPVGLLLVATDDAQMASLRDDPRATGELLDAAGVREAEPALGPSMVGGLLSEDGWRSDPGALTAAAAEAARRAGATIRTGVAVKRLGPGRVLTDAGPFEATTVLLCAGAWSRTLARTAGHDLEVRPVRGWLAITAPGPPLLRHVVYEAEYEAPDGPQPALPVTVADLAAGDLATAGADPALAFAAHQNADGTIMIGATRSAALRETDESAAALRVTAERACRLLPDLAAREVATTWTGLRPFSHDGVPYIGWLEEGLAVCAGHGSEGVLTGAGSGRMVAEIVLGRLPYTDPAAFDPLR